VRSRRDEYVWNLRFDGSQAANAVLKWRKVPFDINVHVARARIDHRISFEDRHVLHLKQISLYRCLQHSKIDGLTRAQFFWIKFGQAIVEPTEPGKFGVQSETAVIADFAIILMETESGSLQRVSSEIRLYVFLGYRFVFGVLCLRSEGRTCEQERQQSNEQPGCDSPSFGQSNPGVNKIREPHRHAANCVYRQRHGLGVAKIWLMSDCRIDLRCR